MKKRHLICALLALTMNTSIAASFDGEMCVAVVQDQDISYRERDVNKWDVLHRTSCTDKRMNSEKNLAGGVEAVYKSIPVKFSFASGDKKSSIQNFCSNYDEYRSEVINTVDFNKRLSESQLNAFTKCVALTVNAQNSKIVPHIGDDLVGIRIKRGSVNSKFEYVHYDDALFKCETYQDGAWVEANKALSGSEINTSADISIACKRKKIERDGESYFEGGTISVSTTQGDLSIPVLRQEEFGPARAIVHKKSVASLNQRNAALLSKVKKLKAKTARVCSGRQSCRELPFGRFIRTHGPAFLAHLISDVSAINKATRDRNGKAICKLLGMKFSRAVSTPEPINCGGTLHFKNYNSKQRRWDLSTHACNRTYRILTQLHCSI